MKTKRSKSRIENAAAMIKNSYQMHRGMYSIQKDYTEDLNSILCKLDQPEAHISSNNSTAISVDLVDNINEPKKPKTKRYKKLDKTRKTIEVDQRPSWVKEVYRTVMRKCHPDMLANLDIPIPEKLYRAEVVLQVQEAINEKKYDEVLFLGITVGVYTEKINFNEQLNMLNNLYSKIVNSIEQIQKSVTWLWGISWDNLEVRIQLINNVFQSKGKSPPPRQTIISQIVNHELE